MHVCVCVCVCVCEQRAQNCYRNSGTAGSRTGYLLSRIPNVLTITQPGHTIGGLAEVKKSNKVRSGVGLHVDTAAYCLRGFMCSYCAAIFVQLEMRGKA